MRASGGGSSLVGFSGDSCMVFRSVGMSVVVVVSGGMGVSVGILVVVAVIL